MHAMIWHRDVDLRPLLTAMEGLVLLQVNSRS